MATIVLEPLSPHYKQWCHDNVLSDVIDASTYWARLDNIMLTSIMVTLSIKLHEIIHEILETAHPR
jgi:uncharacterized membrane protein